MHQIQDNYQLTNQIYGQLDAFDGHLRNEGETSLQTIFGYTNSIYNKSTILRSYEDLHVCRQIATHSNGDVNEFYEYYSRYDPRLFHTPAIGFESLPQHFDTLIPHRSNEIIEDQAESDKNYQQEMSSTREMEENEDWSHQQEDIDEATAQLDNSVNTLDDSLEIFNEEPGNLKAF